MSRGAAFTLSVLAAFAGCDHAPSGPPDLALALGQAPDFPALAAVAAAGDDLAGGGGGPLGPGLGIGGIGGANSLSGTAYRQTRDEGVSLRLSRDLAMRRLASGADLGLVGSVALGASSTAWHLPQGLGVLVDPMDIRVNSQSLASELRLHWARPVTLPSLGPARIEVYAGAGVLQARSQTRLRSALLALDDSSSGTQPYLVAGATLLDAGRGPVTTGLGLRLTASRLGGVEGGLQLELRH